MLGDCMQIKIRSETEQDYKIVEELARDAFWNLYFPGALEHYVVFLMRKHHDFIKDLSFVLEVDGKVCGAIFYTHSKIILDNGSELKTISFGPVFIAPHLHRQGLGKKLITHSINKAKHDGYKAILTLGFPYHYIPYGFVGAKAYNISMPDFKYYTGLLALPLQQGALDGIKGHAEFSTVFDVEMDDVERYDQTNFAPKDKLVTPSQEEYAKACAELDE